MPARLTLEERIFLVKTTYQSNISEACRAFQNRFARSVRWHTVSELIQKFEATGDLNDRKRDGRPATSVNEDTSMTVALTFTENPKQSAKKVSTELDIPRTSLRRIIKKIEFKIWRPRLLHALSEDDPDRRMEFCVNFNDILIPYLDLIIWTDEANFSLLNGTVNRHNCVYYSQENPNVIFEKHVNSPSLTVWAGICSSFIIGPYFFDERVSAQSYLNMLNTFAFPTIRNAGRPDGDSPDYWWQQDGAPPHFGNNVRNALNEEFPGRWIGRRGSVEWPARSPDLTPMDYAVWGIVKEKVFAVKSQDLAQLRERIIIAFNEISQELCQSICRSIPHRIQQCIQSNGHHFE